MHVARESTVVPRPINSMALHRIKCFRYPSGLPLIGKRNVSYINDVPRSLWKNPKKYVIIKSLIMSTNHTYRGEFFGFWQG